MSLALFALILCYLTLNILLKPNNLKIWINDSGLYDSGVQEIKNNINNNELGELSNNPIVIEAIDKVVTKDLLKETVEQGIDANYNWLKSNDKTAPKLQVNIAEISVKIQDQIILSLQTKLNSLPVCTNPNQPISFDVYKISCIPQNISKDQIINYATNYLSGQTSDNSPNEQINLPADQYRNLQTYYQLVTQIQLISIISLIVCLLLAFFIIQPKYRLLRTLAIILIPHGILLYAFGWLLPRKLSVHTKDSPLTHSLQNLASIISTDIGQELSLIGVVLLTIGIILLIFYLVLKRKKAMELLANKPPKINPVAGGSANNLQDGTLEQ